MIHSLKFFVSKKYVRNVEKLTVTVLPASDSVNYSLSSICTAAQSGPCGTHSCLLLQLILSLLVAQHISQWIQWNSDKFWARGRPTLTLIGTEGLANLISTIGVKLPPPPLRDFTPHRLNPLIDFDAVWFICSRILSVIAWRVICDHRLFLNTNISAKPEAHRI